MSLMFSLPPEITNEIMQYLPLADLATLLTVSHASEGHVTGVFSLPPTHLPTPHITLQVHWSLA